MSHTPGTEKAQQIYDSLVAEAAKRWPGYVYPFDVDKDTLREVFISLACPIPCVGEVNDTGWHYLCIGRADAAMSALFGTDTLDTIV